KGYKVAVRFEEKPLPVDPYYLGVWLDEGDVNSPHVAVEAPEVIQAIEEYGKALNEDVVISEHNYADKHEPYTIATGYHGKHEYLSLQSKLRKLNLLGNKHIPQEF